MVNYCANPGCGKPLHYLREGRIYVFDASIATGSPGKKKERQLEHYWLCGACAQSMTMVQDAQGWVRILPRPAVLREPGDDRGPVHSEQAS